MTTTPLEPPEFGGTSTWWTLFPERLEDELRQLDAAGIRYERDEEAEARGVMRLRVFPRAATGEELPLIAQFPDFYPFFRFEVAAPTLDLPYHQNPFEKGLCLLPRRSEFWRPQTDRLAGFLLEQLPKALAAAPVDAPPEAVATEQHQAEPFSDYYEYQPAMLLIDSAWRIDPSVAQGWFTVGVAGPAGVPILDPPAQGAVVSVTDDGGRILQEAAPAIAAAYPRMMRARWVRVDAPIRLADPSAVFRELERRDTLPSQAFSGVELRQGDHAGARLRLRVAIYPEEFRWRGTEAPAPGAPRTTDAWLVAGEIAPPGAAARRGANRPAQHANPAQRAAALRSALQAAQRDPVHYLMRAGRAGPEDLLARVPALRPMQTVGVSIFGLGCLGAPSALEFARAQTGTVTLADFDVVDPGTVVRWPLGLQAAGLLKSAYVRDLIRTNYPYTAVRAFQWKVGAPHGDDAHEGTRLHEMLEGASLVYDASAEPGVRYFLSEVARDRGLPYIGVSATPGGWGGWVVRIRPGRTAGCYRCLEYAFADVPGVGVRIPWPPAAGAAGDVQPVGCADPTFTATSFDVAQVALMGVRMAIGTLTAAHEGGYPDGDWDVAVLHLRDDTGAVIAPRWATYPLAAHPSCPRCGGIVTE